MSDSAVPQDVLTAEQRALLRMVYGTMQAIYVVAKLGVPDMPDRCIPSGVRAFSR